MRFSAILLSFMAMALPPVAADTWTLEDKEGRSIEVEELFYDGKELSFRRVGGYRKHSISPDTLSKKSWDDLSTEMGKKANIRLDVNRTTKTNTDSSKSHSYYSTYKRTEVSKLNRFEIEISSISYFPTDLKIKYFIFSDDEIDYGHIFKQVAFRDPLKFELSKALSHREYQRKSSLGSNYKRKYGSSKAGMILFILNADGDELARHTTSKALFDDYEFLKSNLNKRLDQLPGDKDARDSIDRDLL